MEDDMPMHGIPSYSTRFVTSDIRALEPVERCHSVRSYRSKALSLYQIAGTSETLPRCRSVL